MKKLSLIAAAILASVCMSAQNVESADFTLKAGERGSLSRNYVRYHTVLNADFVLKNFESVSVGRGKEGFYRSAWIEINRDFIIYHECKMVKGKKTDAIRESWPHKLKIKKKLSVTISADLNTADITVRSGKGVWTNNVKWFGGGEAFARNGGESAVKVRLSLERKDLSNGIWFLCDSYGSYGKSRWLWHAVSGGARNWMLDNLPGGTSTDLLKSFRTDLSYGTPQYAVWMLGMNDRKDEKWIKNTQEFISLCREKGIEPVLTTIPSVPGRDHERKSEWVKSSGLRYIDWRQAVESTPDGEWAEGCLSSDKVHPSERGAARLWEQILKDLPEIIR